MNKGVARTILLDEISYNAHHQFNPNAFRNELESIARSCTDKIALIDYSIQIIESEVNNSLESFIKVLHSPQFKGVQPRSDVKMIIIYRDEKYQIGLQSFFTSIKSFLDFYAKIIVKSINESQTINGFHKATIYSQKIAGGTLLKWLEKSTPTSYKNKKKLIKVIKKHVYNWVNDLVDYRDDIIHRGIYKNIEEMYVPLNKRPVKMKKKDVVLPTIKSQDVIEYCKLIKKKFNIYIKETIILLPNIKPEFRKFFLK